MGPYMPHESFLSQREKRKAKDCIRSFVFVLGGCWGCVCMRMCVCVFYGFSEVAQSPNKKEHWKQFISWRRGRQQMVGSYEKQYFRTKWIVGCYLFWGLGATYWKQFIWWEKGKDCYGMALNTAALEMITWSSWWRREEGQRWVRRNNWGKGLVSQYKLKGKISDKVGTRWLTRDRAIMWLGIVQKVGANISSLEHWKGGAGEPGKEPQNRKQYLLKFFFHTLPGKHIHVSRKAENLVDVRILGPLTEQISEKSAIVNWEQQQTPRLSPTKDTGLSSFLFTLRVYRNKYNGESLLSLLRWIWWKSFLFSHWRSWL